MENKNIITEKIKKLNTTLEALNKKIEEKIKNIAKAYLGKEVEHKTLGKGTVIETEKDVFMGEQRLSIQENNRTIQLKVFRKRH